VDMIGLVQAGRLVAFGPKEEILPSQKMRPLVVEKNRRADATGRADAGMGQGMGQAMGQPQRVPAE
ncbi:hypothetical protein B0E45_00190, partial [Sinorhizobium sp. A49]|uniref:hypothetical protein n=1 Tax=Sinorhizobium sp. A49 TaxID=1945861 RepID=UPI0009C9B2A0